MNEKIRLYFNATVPVFLERMKLSSLDTEGRLQEVVSLCERVAHPQERHFRWGKGMKALCLALLRIQMGDASTPGQPLLAGRQGSAAATLDNLVHKASGNNWLREMLSLGTVDARTRLQGWLERQNSQGNNRERPIRIFTGRGARGLRAAQIEVWIEGQAALPARVVGLEGALAEELGEMPWSRKEKEAESFKLSGALPGAGGVVVGRESELAGLEEAMTGEGGRIFQVLAAGGYGKTALVRWWLEQRGAGEKRGGWSRVFVWSFYRQGYTSDAVQPLWPFRQALAQLLEIKLGERCSSEELVTALYEGFMQRPTLLLLDGVEAILHGPGEEEGRLRDDVLPRFFKRVLEGGVGHCLLTSRMPVGDLEGMEGVGRLDLQTLGRESTRRLLRQLKVEGLPVDLEEAVSFSQGHPLLIRLLASRYLAEADGAVEGVGPLALRRLLAELQKVAQYTDRWTQEDPALTQMLRSYARWFAGTPELALLQLSAIFDRLPEEVALLALLNDLAVLGGGWTIWHNLDMERWRTGAQRIRECGLAFPGSGLVLEMHPLVQSFFAEEWRRKDLQGFQAAHERLYEHFRAMPEKDLPDTLEEMQPLFQAVHHGCQAGRYERTFREIAWKRLSRGLEAYILTQLGAFQETRALMGCFCAKGWNFPKDSDLSPENKGGILQAAAHCERVQERLDLAIALMRRAARWAAKGSDPLFAATACFHVIRMAMIRGRMRLGMAYCLRLKYLTLRHPRSFLAKPQNALEREITVFFSSIVACFLLISGRRKDGEPLMEDALELVRVDNAAARFLPGLAMQFHAFWLMETGQKAIVLDAIERGQAEFSSYQYEFNNVSSLVKGWAWTRQATDAGGLPEREHREETVRVLEEAVWQARNFGRWLLLADALLARARWLSHFGREEEYLRDVNQCREIAQQYGFGLILVDLNLLETEHRLRLGLYREAARFHGEAARLVKKHSYKLRSSLLVTLHTRMKTGAKMDASVL